MPKFLEDKLKKEYGDNKHAIYGTMNKIGAMRGNKETAKGKEMEHKHDIKVSHYQKAAPEYIHEKKHDTAKKMKGDWNEFGKTGKAIGKSVKRHGKKEGLAF